ncbi:MAG: hypothetical protein P8Z30_19635 [Acidobacteriota bacterium]
MKKLFMVTAIALCLLVFGLSAAFAAELDLQLVAGTNTQTTSFGTGSHPATTTVYAGDVYLGAQKLAQFTATSTSTNYTGINGQVWDYEIIVPLSGFTGLDYLGDFFSVKTNRINTGVISPLTIDRGIIYAASPALKSLIGLEVEIDGNTLKIFY